MSTLSFQCPLPPRELSPNAGYRGDWRRFNTAAQAYKQIVWAYARNAGIEAAWTAPERVRVSVEFWTKHQKGDGLYRPLDAPNAVSAWKAGYDALVLAGLFSDDNWRVMELGETRIRPDLGPGVFVVVEAIEGELDLYRP